MLQLNIRSHIWEVHRVYHLKYNPKKESHTTIQKWNQKQVHPRVILSPNLPQHSRVKVTIVARPLLTPIAQKSCRCEHGVSRAERVVLEHYFASKSFASVREAFSDAYPDKEVPNNTPTGNKIPGHRMCLFVTIAHRATKQLKLRSYRLKAVH
jgi:hypothetical protein